MFLTISDEMLKRTNALDTAKEISQQPQTWRKTLQLVQSNKNIIQNYLNQLGELGSFDVIFMGAGTSEYIGNS
jgi:tagatose-6-phosphate ketose/aldose isomerase